MSGVDATWPYTYARLSYMDVGKAVDHRRRTNSVLVILVPLRRLRYVSRPRLRALLEKPRCLMPPSPISSVAV